jgi:hypothetical protein
MCVRRKCRCRSSRPASSALHSCPPLLLLSLSPPPRCSPLPPGIEWDDATRGKGDGAVTTSTGEEVRYFRCGDAATALALGTPAPPLRKAAAGGADGSGAATTGASFLKTDLVQTGITIDAAVLDR